MTGQSVLSSEWAKLWSLRSTWITLSLGLLFLFVFGLIAASRYKSGIDFGHLDHDFAQSMAVSLSLVFTLGAFVVFGFRSRIVSPLPAAMSLTPSGVVRSLLALDSTSAWSARSAPRSARCCGPWPVASPCLLAP